MAGEGDKYITNGTWLRCDKGAVPGQLTVMPKTATLYGQYWATQLDAVPLVNIPSFGACMVTRTPCAPLTALWTNVMDTVSVQGQPPLLDVSTCQCAVGGLINIYFSQQAALAAGPRPSPRKMPKLSRRPKKTPSSGATWARPCWLPPP